MTTRSSVLSDAHIMKHCAIYNPIPMKIADKLLHQDLNVHTSTPFTTKKLKYKNAISRPSDFNALAKTLTRIGGNDARIYDALVKDFRQEVNDKMSPEMKPSETKTETETETETKTEEPETKTEEPGSGDPEMYRLPNLPLGQTREGLAMERAGVARAAPRRSARLQERAAPTTPKVPDSPGIPGDTLPDLLVE